MERKQGHLESETFSENELIAALINAQELFDGDTAGFYRTEDICDMTGWNLKRVRNELRQLIGAGKVEVGVVRIIDLAGRHTTVPAYRWKEKAPG